VRTLLDAILEANAARAGGSTSARAELAHGAMPFVISCMDPRMVGNLVPAMGLAESPPPQAKFAGALVLPGDRAASRSVLAAAIFNLATEVIVVGHTDCRMGRFGIGDVDRAIERLGIPSHAFDGKDPALWLGVFSSVHDSIRASVAAMRADPHVPAHIPVHGLLFHLDSRRLEKIVDGYAAAAGPAVSPFASAAPTGPAFAAPSFAPTPPPPPPGSAFTPGPASFGGPAPTAGAYGTVGPVRLDAPPPPSFGSYVPSSALSPPAPPPPAAHSNFGHYVASVPTFAEPAPAPPPPPPPVLEPLPAKHKKRSGVDPFAKAKEILDRQRRG
jgi:carbonic anhydrase